MYPAYKYIYIHMYVKILCRSERLSTDPPHPIDKRLRLLGTPTPKSEAPFGSMTLAFRTRGFPQVAV